MTFWERLLDSLKEIYHNSVDWVLQNRIIAIGAAVVLFVGFVLIGAYTSTSKEDLREELESAIAKKDYGKMKEFFVSKDPDLEITDEFIENWVNRDNVNKLFNDDDELSVDQTHIEDRGKIFKSYKIVVSPITLKIQVDNPDRILVNGEPIQIQKNAKEHTYGPVLPGKYKIQAEKKYPLATITDEKNMNAWKEEAIVALDLSVENHRVMVDIDSGGVIFKKGEILPGTYEGAKFFLDGKPIKPEKNDEGKLFIGPLAKNKKYQIYAEWTYPWGTVRSDIREVTIKSDKINKVVLTPTLKGEIRKQLTDLFNTFAKQYVESQRKKDRSVITVISDNYTILVPGDDQTFEGELIRTAIDFRKSYVYYGNPNKIYLYASKTLTRKVTFGHYKPDKTEQSSSLRYELVYNPQSKKWLIEDSNIDTGDYSEDNPDAVITNFK